MILHSKATLGWDKPWLMRFILGVNHAPGAGSSAQPVDLQSSALPLCYDCPLESNKDAHNKYAAI